MQCYVKELVSTHTGVDMTLGVYEVPTANNEDEISAGTQFMRMFSFQPAGTDVLAHIRIPHEQWNELKVKPSVGDNYNLTLNDNEIRFEKI